MINDFEHQIINILADGKFHSGENIATELGITRASVWKKIKIAEEEYALDIQAISGKGYRLLGGLDLLNQSQIVEDLLSKSLAEIIDLTVFNKIESTNQYLLDRKNSGTNNFSVCLAEMQTHGRGRRGKEWLSPFAANINLSIGCTLNMPMFKIAGLSIAVGVAVAEALSQLGIESIALKWPNDIHINAKKIAGLLVELKGEAEGPVKTVIGIGLNVKLPKDTQNEIDQPVTDVFSSVSLICPNRNQISVKLIEKVSAAVLEFSSKGLLPFITRWQEYDVYLGQSVVIKNAHNQVEGIYKGIDVDGGFILENNEGITVHNAGEVSMRAVTS